MIRGFKKSHHNDETGKTEEFYDEAHDEGSDYNNEGKFGSFGEGRHNSYQGAQGDSYLNVDQQKKGGQFDSKQFVDKKNANEGQYGQSKYKGSGELYGSNNGIDRQSLLGHQESSKAFKHYPYHVPFYHH